MEEWSQETLHFDCYQRSQGLLTTSELIVVVTVVMLLDLSANIVDDIGMAMGDVKQNRDLELRTASARRMCHNVTISTDDGKASA